MRKVKWIVFITVAVLLLVSPNITIADIPAKESLRGIKGFYVEILELDQYSKKMGLTKQSLKKDTELKLKTAGVRVLSLQELPGESGSPCLRVHVYSTSSVENDGSVAVLLYVFVQQKAKLARNADLGALYLKTWDTSNLKIVGKNVFKELVRKEIKVLVDEFLNDYLSVNPKKQE